MRKPACPKCSQKDQVIPIRYGYPNHALFERSEKGLVKLGGCCISEFGQPDFYCKRCQIEWAKDNPDIISVGDSD